ncbi:hypothetical protein BC936DRAFT_143136 [Jimgerdemannia flammicorona]|uniref:DUF7905 domain-containing protein n=1 Tax=Jimgerdemannia flammicorona TaxID=994334 RepID=A0A432ZZL4_9FUNG|nr:hypothetical protein BC936DRAFT_143136 [Jimgerdemannia flammicorona]
MDPLFEYLNAHGLNEYTDSPRTSFVIEANQVLEFVQPSRSRGNAYPSPRFDTRIDCSFKKDGKIGLWDCVTEHQELLTASMINLEKNYAWELKLESARRVPTDRPSPHGQLIHTLRLKLVTILLTLHQY